MAKTKDFILEVLKALVVGAGNGGNEIEDNDVSSLLKQNADILSKSNESNENAGIKLDSIYNLLVANRNILTEKKSKKETIENEPVAQKITQSPMPNIDNFFNINGYIPVMVLNPGYGEDDDFDIGLPDRVKPGNRPKVRPGSPRQPKPKPSSPRQPKPKPSSPRQPTPKPTPKPGSPSTGGPARYPRPSPGAGLPPGYIRNSEGRVIDAKTGRYVSSKDIAALIEAQGVSNKWVRYTKLLRFLGVAGAIIPALIDPAIAMYNDAPYEEVRKQLIGALGSVSGAVLGAAAGAAGAGAVAGPVGAAVGGLIGGITGAFAGEWTAETLADFLLGDEETTVQPTNPLPNYGEGDESYMGEPPPPVYDPITGIEISGDMAPAEIPEPQEETPITPTETSGMLTPASHSSYDYGEQETPDEEYVTIDADQIHFIGDIIKFVYGSVGDGTYYENGGIFQSDTGGASLISASLSTGDPAGYMSPQVGGGGGGVMPQEGPTSPAMPAPDLSGNPTEAKTFLSSISANRNRPGDTSMLNDDFAERLARLIQSAPAGIRQGLGVGSAYRSAERQAEIISENMGRYGFGAGDRSAWNSDVASMGPEAAGEKWRSRFRAAGLTANIGMPGGSRHQHGLAVDLTYNGTMLRPGNVPPDVLSWVHANAGNFGLHFPMGHEPWHIEPVTARADQPTVMAGTDTPATAGNVASPSTADATTVPPAGGNSPETTAPSAAPAGNSVTTGQDIAERSTETYANARIGNPTFAGSAGVTATGAPIITASTIDPPYETAGIDKPIAAMTATEQSIFERSGLFA